MEVGIAYPIVCYFTAAGTIEMFAAREEERKTLEHVNVFFFFEPKITTQIRF